ncbi:unnamed protein product [Trifolium pratense]|uniref:Uncharacterized protein n=1 Tax=Trifolium pratense TaxID=57577 RepID=A0ACB0LBT1_TRIPR|nr:unnamed protein product [Trifolium pratense]
MKQFLFLYSKLKNMAKIYMFFCVMMVFISIFISMTNCWAEIIFSDVPISNNVCWVPKNWYSIRTMILCEQDEDCPIHLCIPPQVPKCVLVACDCVMKKP